MVTALNKQGKQKMRKLLNTITIKVKSFAELAAKWLVKLSFEVVGLTSVAYTVMHLISAAFAVEVILAGISVLATAFFTKRKW